MTGFDCSGFVSFLLKEVNFPLADDIRHCNEYLDRFGVFIHWEARLPGDLLIFSRNGRKPTHMGILINESQFIHAPGMTNTVVEISEAEETPISYKYRDQLYFTNPIALKRLAIPSGRWLKI